MKTSQPPTNRARTRTSKEVAARASVVLLFGLAVLALGALALERAAAQSGIPCYGYEYTTPLNPPPGQYYNAMSCTTPGCVLKQPAWCEYVVAYDQPGTVNVNCGWKDYETGNYCYPSQYNIQVYLWTATPACIQDTTCHAECIDWVEIGWVPYAVNDCECSTNSPWGPCR
jgi:hypothetical protein